MPNSIDSIVPKILARGMLTFREKALMPRLVNNDFSAEAAQKGDSIEVPVSGKVTVSDVTPGVNPPAPDDSSITSHTLQLDNWKKASFYLNDKDLAKVEADRHFVPFQLHEAVSALAESVNASFMEEVKFAANLVGHGNKALFTSSGEAAETGHDYYKANPAIHSRRRLNENLAPKEGRYAILGYEAEAAALALPEFADAEKSGDSGVRIEGEIGRKYGINWYASSLLYNHEGTTGNNQMGVRSDHAVGDTALQLAGVNTELKPGDVLVLKTGQTPVATVKSKASGTANYNIVAPLAAAIARDTKLDVVGDHASSVIFHRDAFAFATRPLASLTQEYGFGNRILSVTDPVSGLSLRLEVSRQYKQTVWELDILWGVKMVRPEFLVRLFGA